MDQGNVGRPAQSEGERGSLLGLALAGVLLVAGLSWFAWSWYSTPTPPAIDLGDSADPAVVKAVNEARLAVERDPRSAAAWGHLGQLLLAHTYVVEARPCFAQAERLDPADPRWPYLQGWGDLLNHPENSVPCFERALDRCGADAERREAVQLRLAQTLLDRGQLDAAREHFSQLLGSGHATPLAHLGLGSVALDRGELPIAADHLQNAANSPLSRQRARTALAKTSRRLGQKSLADDWERRARQLPRDAEWSDPFLREGEDLVVGKQMRLLRAENYQRDGQLARAAEMCRQLIRDYPEDTRARVKLGMVLVEQGDYQAAETVLRELLRIDPGKVQGHFLLSAALFNQAERRAREPARKEAAFRQFQEAADEAQAALELQPNHGFAHLYRGLSLRHLGRLDEAVRALEDAVRCSPESVDPHLHLGETLVMAGRVEDGLKQLEDAVRAAPSSDPRPQKALKKAHAKK